MKSGYSDAALPLTPRMVDVLASAAAGRTITQTALELGITESTVRGIRAAACARLDAPNVTAAVALSILARGFARAAR